MKLLKKILNRILNKISDLFLSIPIFKNWLSFIFSSVRIDKKTNVFRLRNGIVMKVERETDNKDWSTHLLTEIFVRKGYGDIPTDITVIDIGANIGAFAISATYGKNNICYSYEPDSKNFELLRENIIANGLHDKVKPFKLAVAENCEDKKLFKFEFIAHSLIRESDKYDIVKCIDLKTIIEENNIDTIDLIKIDCEGGEYDIIYSTEKSIFDKIDRMILEYHNYSDKKDYNGKALVRYMEDLGFQVLDWELIQNGVLGVVQLRNKNSHKK